VASIRIISQIYTDFLVSNLVLCEKWGDGLSVSNPRVQHTSKPILLMLRTISKTWSKSSPSFTFRQAAPIQTLYEPPSLALVTWTLTSSKVIKELVSIEV
jgi:hypothetical protein